MTPPWLVIVLSTALAVGLILVVLGLARRAPRRNGASGHLYVDSGSAGNDSSAGSDVGSAAGSDGGGGGAD